MAAGVRSEAKQRQSIVSDVLDRFQIVAKKDLYPSQLSGGQQQLVGVARAGETGEPLTQKMVQGLVRRAERQANLKLKGVHALRHTFCSHLAMKGAPARAIQELAGHQDLATTQRYMHLSPAALDTAIRLLDAPPVLPSHGEIR